jgi:hypothetical protein
VKTKAKTVAGPTVDTAFFDDLAEVFDRYPDMARKYAVRDLTIERDVLHIDFEKQHAVTHIDGKRIITEFHDRDEKVVRSSHHACCEWIKNGRWSCVQQCIE